MPRSKGRGGARAGTPGESYGNRTDLNGAKVLPVQTVRSRQYGSRAAQEEAQRAVPMGTPTAPEPAAAAPAAAGPDPGSLGDLLGPTARPGEPITAGMPFGPGSSGAGLRRAADDPDVDLLLALYRANPSPALADLIEAIRE